MLASSVPNKFPIPFANSAGGSYTRNVPTASQIGIQNGAASLTDGFPPLCFQPVGSGGFPPFGQDFNGILKQITQWGQWQAAAGPIFYDSVFSAAIGGYPKGTLLQAAVGGGAFWLSTVDNNTSDPDTGGANWLTVILSGAYLPLAGGTMTGTIGMDSSVAAMVFEVSSTNIWSINTQINGLGAGNSPLTLTNLSTFENVLYFDQATGLGYVLGPPTAQFGIVNKGYADTRDNIILANAETYADGAWSAAASGYFQLPNGVIVQWASSTFSGGSGTVTWPLTFPNAVFKVWATDTDGGATNYTTVVAMQSSITTSGCTVLSGYCDGAGGHSWTGAVTARVFAIGN